jgi:hypothetical protein
MNVTFLGKCKDKKIDEFIFEEPFSMSLSFVYVKIENRTDVDIL